MKNLASAMTGIHGEPITLTDVAISARLQELLAEVTVAQTYRNGEAVHIEAVYTFPLPLDAVLLDLELRIGDRTLHGTVVEKRAAEETYENAVESGDTAVMLQVLEPGLYTMNLGNLQAGETATIVITYAMLNRWNEDRLRIMLPTTVAPRYGQAVHLPHQTPEHTLTVENQFSLDLEIVGVLSDAQLDCPSHAVVQSREPGRTRLALRQPKAAMDRDFVLNLKSRHATRDCVMCGPDGAGAAAIACMQPYLPGLREPRALDLVIIIDCSGSMQGDSIKQARRAIMQIIDGLGSDDRVGIVAFGSTARCLHDSLLRFTPANSTRIREFATEIDANMGGTEINGALRTAFSIPGKKPADILLITDGEVTNWQTVVHQARTAGHRIFTVGVGGAVTEAFVRELAASTGAACELAAPREDIAEQVLRQFERMRAPRSKATTLHWPRLANQIAPSTFGTVYEGDTLVSTAQFEQWPAAAQITLEVKSATGEIHRQHVRIPPSCADSSVNPSTVARLAASLRIKDLPQDEATSTALRYRLISPWSHWIVVAERAAGDKANELPVLRKVPQTLAAGWGGTGSLQTIGTRPELRQAMYSSFSFRESPLMDSMERLDYPMSDMATRRARREAYTRHRLTPARRILEIILRTPSRLAPKHAMDLLSEAGLVPRLRKALTQATASGLSEETVATLLLALILKPHMQDIPSDEARCALHEFLDHAEMLQEQISVLGALERELERSAGRTKDFQLVDQTTLASLNQVGAALSSIAPVLDELKAVAHSLAVASLFGYLDDNAI